MFKLDRVRKAKIPEVYYNEAISYIKTVVRHSIKESFADNQFWRDLHPQLRKKLFNIVLSDVTERF